MQPVSCKVLVLGGGPGGYVTAIRAGQLGLVTILVEPERLGGTCLNIGCIPSKALIHAADEFHRAHHFTKLSPLGIRAGDVSLDFDRTQAWMAGIIERLTGGVGGLLRRAKVRVMRGHGRMLDGKTCMAETPDGQFHITAEHIVLATGSEPVAMFDLPFGGPILSSTEALALAEIPERLVRLVVGSLHLLAELAGPDVVAGEDRRAHLREDGLRRGIVPVARGARPQRGLIELEMLGRRVAEDHGPEPAVADGQRLGPARGRLVITQREIGTRGVDHQRKNADEMAGGYLRGHLSPPILRA